MRISDWSSDVCSSDLHHPDDTHRAARSRTRQAELRVFDGRAEFIRPGRLKPALLRDALYGGHGMNAKPPLSRVRVIDFSTLLPGPLATLVLAEAGAEVIKIERPDGGDDQRRIGVPRSEEHTAELQSLMRTSYAVFCWKK